MSKKKRKTNDKNITGGPMMKKTRAEIKKLTKQEQIDYYTYSKNLICMRNGNTKTGIGCMTISFPVVTCREDAPCKKEKKCYCMKGRQQCAPVLGAYFRNWRIWTEDPKAYEEQFNHNLTYCGIKLIRYNDCGEIPNEKYLNMMCRMANKHHDISFLVYTKKYELINGYVDDGNAIPDNLTIRFSAWDKTWPVPNPHNFPMAYVDFKDKSKNPVIAENAYKCSCDDTTCSMCRICWLKDVNAVVFAQH